MSNRTDWAPAGIWPAFVGLQIGTAAYEIWKWMIERRRRPVRDSLGHLCKYCPIKAQRFASVPQLQFRPSTLRQQCLLQIAYMTYEKTGDQSADNLPLPKHLRDEIKGIHEEIYRWNMDMRNLHKMIERRFVFGPREIDLDSTDYRCFLTNLHWIPGTGVIDRQATASMILQCNVGFDPRHEFFMAAANCLEEDVTRLWAAMSHEDRNSLERNRVLLFFGADPIFSYWIAKLTNRPMMMEAALRLMTYSCMHFGDHYFVTLKYFWPMIVENMGGMEINTMKHLIDHAFHRSIECGNSAITFFIWNQAPPSNRRSMISAARCCGGGIDSYYTFHTAVERGQYVVRFMWDSMGPEQQNGMLLAGHAKSFCKAAEKGYVEIAQLFWNAATFNQRFILLFEQSCLAFRQACANGHFGIVRMLWEYATVDSRRTLLAIPDWEAMPLACRNGHLEVVQYLWENMGDELRSRMETLIETSMMLSKCICESASLIIPDTSSKAVTDGMEILQYIFSLGASTSNSTVSPFKSQLVYALFVNNAAALKALLKRGITTGRWNEIADLLKAFDQEERDQLRKKMTTEQAYLCGISSTMSDGSPSSKSSTEQACTSSFSD